MRRFRLVGAPKTDEDPVSHETPRQPNPAHDITGNLDEIESDRCSSPARSPAYPFGAVLGRPAGADRDNA